MIKFDKHISLNTYPVLDNKKGREGFFAATINNLYYLCYIKGENGCTHAVPISEEFYNDFIKENQRNLKKHELIFK